MPSTTRASTPSTPNETNCAALFTQPAKFRRAQGAVQTICLGLRCGLDVSCPCPNASSRGWFCRVATCGSRYGRDNFNHPAVEITPLTGFEVRSTLVLRAPRESGTGTRGTPSKPPRKKAIYFNEQPKRATGARRRIIRGLVTSKRGRGATNSQRA